MILTQIIEEKEKIVAKRKEGLPLEKIMPALEGISSSKLDFKKYISAEGINLIAEIKRKSPSKGLIRHDFDPLKIAVDYAMTCAGALSVLTDEKFFGGDLVYIKEIKKVVNLPVLQKDFIIDEYQIYEAAFYGADAVLLIADILSREQIAGFKEVASELGMASLCEVHNEEDLEKVISADAEIVGINNRNLHDFKVDLETTTRLIRHIPEGKVIVSESGIKTNKDVMFLKSLGVNALLIGEAFMEAADIRSKVREVMGK